MPTHNSIGALSELLSFQCLPDFSPSSACTAAPIEISYHDETFFTAEIEFVDIEVWKTEVDIALTYLFDEEGNLLHNPPAEAEKSLAKVRRAYELLTKAQFPIQIRLVYPDFNENPLRNADGILEAYPSMYRLDFMYVVSDTAYRHFESSSRKKAFVTANNLGDFKRWTKKYLSPQPSNAEYGAQANALECFYTADT